MFPKWKQFTFWDPPPKSKSVAERAPVRPRLAVLIDGENVPPGHADELFSLVAPLGDAVVRVVINDWQGSGEKGWKQVLPTHAIEPIQQFSYAAGSNAVDMSLVIRAMDLHHSGQIDAFCLVSGDRDYLPLVARLRRDGVPVYGFGPSHSSQALKDACTHFYTFARSQPKKAKAKKQRPAAKPQPAQPPAIEDEVVELLLEAVTKLADERGWVTVSALGDYFRATIVGYRPKKWGRASLSKVLAATGRFELYRSDKEHSRVRILPIDEENAPQTEPSSERLTLYEGTG